MDEGDGHGAFTNGGRAALDGAVADIASGEESRHAGFQVVRSTLERPLLGKNAVSVEVWARDQIAVLIATDADIGGPLGVGLAAKTEKEKTGVDGLLLAGLIVGESDGAQHEIAVESGDSRVWQNFNVWRGHDTVNEVLGKSGLQAVPANHDANFFGGA